MHLHFSVQFSDVSALTHLLNPVINSWAESGVLKPRNYPTVKSSRDIGPKLDTPGLITMCHSISTSWNEKCEIKFADQNKMRKPDLMIVWISHAYANYDMHTRQL